MSYVTTKNCRALHIRFDAYGAEDDADFKRELIVLMSGSLRELQTAASMAISAGECDLFRKAAHKAKSTLTLINDAEFTRAVDEFGTEITQSDSPEAGKQMLERFNAISESIIQSLDFEARRLKAKI